MLIIFGFPLLLPITNRLNPGLHEIRAQMRCTETELCNEKLETINMLLETCTTVHQQLDVECWGSSRDSHCRRLQKIDLHSKSNKGNNGRHSCQTLSYQRLPPVQVFVCTFPPKQYRRHESPKFIKIPQKTCQVESQILP